MKFSMVPAGTPQKSLNHNRTRMIDKFKNPKYEWQCIIELKEIKQSSGESIQDFKQRFKSLKANVSCQISEVQHKDFFIVTLSPHIHVPLMQYNIVSQIKALEIGMKLEVSLVGESGARTTQIQSQLANMSPQIQDIRKGKEIDEYVLCTRCKIEDHHKDSFPAFMYYLASSAPNPLNSQGMSWCRICQTRGHH